MKQFRLVVAACKGKEKDRTNGAFTLVAGKETYHYSFTNRSTVARTKFMALILGLRCVELFGKKKCIVIVENEARYIWKQSASTKSLVDKYWTAAENKEIHWNPGITFTNQRLVEKTALIAKNHV